MNKKGLASVVATALLIVIAVLSTITFQTWNQTFLSNQFSNVEGQNSITDLYILDVIENNLYLKSNSNLIYDNLKIYDNNSSLICSISYNENSDIIAYWSFENHNSTHLFSDLGEITPLNILSGNLELIGENSNSSCIILNSHNYHYEYLANTRDYFYNNWTLEIMSGNAKGEKRKIIKYVAGTESSTFDSFPKYFYLNSSISNFEIGDEYWVYYNGDTLIPNFSLGRFGVGITFDGIDDKVSDLSGSTYLNLNANNDESKSISFWFKAGNQSHKADMIYKNGNCIGYVININTEGKVTSSISTGASCSDNIGYSVTSSESYNDNQWHHLVAVYDRDVNDHIELYIDKILIGNTSIDNRDSNRGNLRFGTCWDSSQPFNGSLDEVIIFNKTLTLKEINSLYESPISQPSGINLIDISSCNLDKDNTYEFLLTSNSGVYSKEFYYD